MEGGRQRDGGIDRERNRESIRVSDSKQRVVNSDSVTETEKELLARGACIERERDRQ